MEKPNRTDMIIYTAISSFPVKYRGKAASGYIASGLTKSSIYDTINAVVRGVAQLVARLLWEQDAASSSLVTSTKFLRNIRLRRNFLYLFLCPDFFDIYLIITSTRL